METRDLYRAAKAQAESEIPMIQSHFSVEANDARRKWNESHWWVFCSEKLLEHMTGQACYRQFDKAKFGILNGEKDKTRQLTAKHQELRASAYGSNGNHLELRNELFQTYNELLA